MGQPDPPTGGKDHRHVPALLDQGSVLDDRYRLDERVGEQGCAALWRGTDTILARSVTVMVLPTSAPETARVLTAARRAARIRDSRVVQVFDTATVDDSTYVITEWITGRTLTDLLLETGPLHPDRAGALVGEAAEALTEAHRMAVSHLRLTPDNLVWTAAGGVKVTGVGIEAALAGTVSDDPARTDSEGLGALLYAALTARWPHGPFGGLLAAPQNGDAPHFSPRQVRAGVPPELDATTERALCQRSRRGQPPLATPASVAEALADFPDPTPLDLFAERPSSDDRATNPMAQVTAPVPFATAGGPRPHHHHRGRRALIAVPAGLALVAVVLVGGLRLGLSEFTFGGPSAAPSESSSSTSPTPAGKKRIPVVEASDFDPQGDGQEHASSVKNANDGTPRTVWYTDRYNTAKFGNLKPGVGMVFDLGSAKAVDSVQLRLGDPGTSLQLRSATSGGTSVGDFTTVATATDVDEQVTLRPKSDATARYWLVWFTELPRSDDGYRAGIADITFRPAS
ncbi:MAG: serine/threonine protein kinase [Streptosporangiales bacterium]|nr:serine/threonine protein kinase [Streptosporangiales bacterium]